MLFAKNSLCLRVPFLLEEEDLKPKQASNISDFSKRIGTLCLRGDIAKKKSKARVCA